jgi:hypothetical protein
LSYYEVVQVQWDVRDARHYQFYRPGEEGECYLTVFVKPVKNGPGETFDRTQRAEERARQRPRRPGARRGRSYGSGSTIPRPSSQADCP